MIDWPKIVERYGPDIWRTAYRLLSDTDDANDCYQETFLQAVEFSRKHEVQNWAGVLKRIATTRALDLLRRRYKRRSEMLSVDGIVGHGPDPEKQEELQEWMEQLRDALALLPEKQAETFWLSEVELLSHCEIAKNLEGTTKQVAVWLYRAKIRLRELMSKPHVGN